MSKFVGESVGVNSDGSRQSNLPRGAERGLGKFYLMVHPDQWSWDPELEKFMPVISKLYLDPGVQGVDAPRQGVIDSSLAEAFYNAKGYIILPIADPRLKDAFPGGTYQKRWKTNSGKFAYTFSWESPDVFRNNVVWEQDAEARANALNIIATRLLPAMDSRLIVWHMGRAERQLNAAARLINAHPLQYEVLKDKVERRLELMNDLLLESGDKSAIRLARRMINTINHQIASSESRHEVTAKAEVAKKTAAEKRKATLAKKKAEAAAKKPNTSE